MAFFKSFTNFNLLKRCYDTLLSFYNRMSHGIFSSSKAEKTWKHECTAGCGLVGCSYGERHQSPSFKKAQGLFCVDNFERRSQPRRSFSYVYCQEGSNVWRCV